MCDQNSEECSKRGWEERDGATGRGGEGEMEARGEGEEEEESRLGCDQQRGPPPPPPPLRKRRTNRRAAKHHSTAHQRSLSCKRSHPRRLARIRCRAPYRSAWQYPSHELQAACTLLRSTRSSPRTTPCRFLPSSTPTLHHSQRHPCRRPSSRCAIILASFFLRVAHRCHPSNPAAVLLHLLLPMAACPRALTNLS